MTTLSELEKRVAKIEQAVDEINKELAARQQPANWLDKVIGSISDDEAFGKVLEYGRAFREADRPCDDNGEAS